MAGEVCQVSGARNSLLPLLTCELWKPGCVCSYGTSSSFLQPQKFWKSCYSMQFAFGELVLHCSLSEFSDLSLACPSFSTVLNEAIDTNLSPYLDQNHKAVLLPSARLSWWQWQEKPGECFQMGDQRLWWGLFGPLSGRPLRAGHHIVLGIKVVQRGDKIKLTLHIQGVQMFFVFVFVFSPDVFWELKISDKF